MAENCRTAVLAIQKVVEKKMDEFSQRPECEIADILRESEGSESDAHRQMGKSRLRQTLVKMRHLTTQRQGGGRTSIITPGTNIKTASPWNDFRLELSDIDELCQSAASHTSGGFWEYPLDGGVPFGTAGSMGLNNGSTATLRFGRRILLGRAKNFPHVATAVTASRAQYTSRLGRDQGVLPLRSQKNAQIQGFRFSRQYLAQVPIRPTTIRVLNP